VSKERAEFLGTLLEKFHEAGDSVFELGLVREHFLTGKSLLVIVGTVIASPFDWMSSRGSSKRPDSVPGCSREDNRPRSGACFPEAIFSPVWRDRPPNDQRWGRFSVSGRWSSGWSSWGSVGRAVARPASCLGAEASTYVGFRLCRSLVCTPNLCLFCPRAYFQSWKALPHPALHFCQPQFVSPLQRPQGVESEGLRVKSEGSVVRVVWQDSDFCGGLWAEPH